MSEIAAFLESHRSEVDGLDWADYVGNDGAKREIDGLIWGMTHRDELVAAGIAPPRGLIIAGSPGAGKTHLARVTASLIRRDYPTFPFYEINAIEIDPDRLRAIAAFARDRATPMIIFVDEADTFALRRDAKHHTERSRALLVAFLNVLDGLQSPSPIFWLMASATGRDRLDGALLRPGRLGFFVTLQDPPPDERAALFRYFARSLKLSPELNFDAVAELAGRISPADIRQLVGRAYLLAHNAGDLELAEGHFLEALGRGDSVTAAEYSPDFYRHGATAMAAMAVVGRQRGLAASLIRLGLHWVCDFEGLSEIAATNSVLCHLSVAYLSGAAAEQQEYGDSYGLDLGSERARRLLMARLGSGLLRSFPLLSLDAYPSADASDLAYEVVSAELRELDAEAQRAVIDLGEPIRALADILLARRQMGGVELLGELARLLPEAPALILPLPSSTVPGSSV